VVKPAKFHYNYRDPDEQVEYQTSDAGEALCRAAES
jgi:hypothetical protein